MTAANSSSSARAARRAQLVAVAANEFAFVADPMQRVKFKVAGDAATELELIRGDGSKVVAARNP